MKPEHIAIIMDGNRRWAREKGLPATDGHKEGAKNIESLTKYANRIGIKYLTVYAFSTENWKRAEDEVNLLMILFKRYLDKYIVETADTENIRVKIIGDRTKLSKNLNDTIDKAEEKTKNNTGLTFIIAINYGGRDEIVHGVRKIAEKVKSGELEISDIDEDAITNSLYTRGIPDPDLVIRTSGEIRTSGFLTWETTYSEYIFVEKNWPDFKEKDLDDAIEEFAKRNRKFGGK